MTADAIDLADDSDFDGIPDLFHLAIALAGDDARDSEGRREDVRDLLNAIMARYHHALRESAEAAQEAMKEVTEKATELVRAGQGSGSAADVAAAVTTAQRAGEARGYRG